MICLGLELDTKLIFLKRKASLPIGATNFVLLCVSLEENGRGHIRDEQCHRTVNVMYRHRHTVHLTMFSS